MSDRCIVTLRAGYAASRSSCECELTCEAFMPVAGGSAVELRETPTELSSVHLKEGVSYFSVSSQI